MREKLLRGLLAAVPSLLEEPLEPVLKAVPRCVAFWTEELEALRMLLYFFAAEVRSLERQSRVFSVVQMVEPQEPSFCAFGASRRPGWREAAF